MVGRHFFLAIAFGSLVAACGDDEASNEGSGAAGDAAGGAAGAGGIGGAGGMPTVDCPAGEKLGTAAGADGLFTAGGIRYNVRAPADYEPERAHPLLVVLSPRVNDDSAEALEQFTGLTPDATARGYVLAYAEWFDPVPPENRADSDTIRTDVANTWCIDAARVYYTGHSDGGSVVTLLTLGGAPIAAVAPSAAGIDDSDAAMFPCTKPIPAMVIHSSDDMIFPMPAHGQVAADAWAMCSSCAAPGAPQADGCVSYAGCAEGSEVQYCEATGGHYEWYGLNASMLDFFDRHTLVSR
jgi:polyhydroxybutyrate depolymerase